MAEGVGRRAHLGGLERRGARPLHGVRARDAALPVGRAAHRASQELLARRRRRALLAPFGPSRASSDGLRRLRTARREPRDQERTAPARGHRGGHRPVPGAVPALGHLDRLDPRVRHPRAALLPLDAMAVPAPVRARSGLPQGGGGQLVSQGPDGSGQRAGHRRPLRALRHGRGGAAARAVVLPHHRVRRAAARRPRDGRMASARGGHAGALDRSLRRRRGRVPLRGAGNRLPGVHHAPGHAVRGHVLRHGAGAPRRVPPQRLSRGTRVRQPRAARDARGARRRERGRRPVSRSAALC